MNKLSYFDIKRLLRSCNIGFDYETITKTPFTGFSHIHKWDHGYETCYGYNGSRREFYYDLFTVVNFLQDYFAYCEVEYLIISPLFNENPFVYKCKKEDKNIDIINETKLFLKSYNIFHGTKSGAIINVSDLCAITMIIEGSFRGATKLCMFSPEREIVIEANHHFGVTIWTPNPEKEKMVVTNILEKYPDLSNC